MTANSNVNFKDIELFLRENSSVLELFCNSEKRRALASLNSRDIENIFYFIKNPWINLETIVNVADSIMDISPETSWNELINILCKDAAILTDARSATCRTYDPGTNRMVARGSYNWAMERTESIPYEDSLAGWVVEEKKHYCVPDINSEPMYKEKNKILSMGISSMLALPIQLTDYEGGAKQDVLLGSLQLYYEEKNKKFYSQQIRIVKTVVNRFSYVLAQKRKLDYQKKSKIIQESRKGLVAILKQTQSLDHVLSFIVTKIAETINVNRCSLFSIEEDQAGDRFALLIAGYPLAPLAHRYGITLSFKDHSAFKEVFETGRQLLIEDAIKDPRMKANYDLYLNKKIENVYFVPIKDEEGYVTNVLVLDGDESKPLEKDDMFFCNALIQDIEICIQTSIQSQQRHDFLNQMLSFGSIAKVYTKKLSSSDTTTEELNILHKKLHKSLMMVNDIITDRVPYAQKERFNLNDLVSERLEAYYFPPQVRINRKSAEKNIIINADRKKIGRVIGNLLDNAHKKLGELKKGVLEVFSYTENNFAVVDIANTGSIPCEIQNFLQDNKPLYDHSGKGGLGLAIVKLFTVMHNGILECESPPDENRTLFRVKLPM